MTNLKLLKGILTISISICWSFLTSSETPDTHGISVREVREPPLHFADKLFNERMYKRALVEYERLNFFSPDSYFQEKIGQCYWKLGELENAAIAFEEAGAAEELIRVYLELERYSLARFVCEDLITPPQAGSLKIGWIYTLEGRWDLAAQSFKDIGRDDLGNAVLLAKELPYKSEDLALLLSMVVPGAGEIYAKKRLDGTLTLALNLITGGLAIKSFRKKDYISGALITTFFWHRFYHGGIVNAKRATRNYNEKARAQYLKEICGKYNCPFNYRGQPPEFRE